MKRFIIGFVVVFLFLGCAEKQGQEDIAININGIGFTVSEFQNAFENSRYANMGEEGKKKFLDTFISRKLVLKEAEEAGLDKEPEFLQDVQLFWEQSLLKRALARKSKELAVEVEVTDKEVQEYYKKNKENLGGKDLSDVYGAIKTVLRRSKQSQAVTEWINSLRSNAQVQVNYEQLDLEEK